MRSVDWKPRSAKEVFVDFFALFVYRFFSFQPKTHHIVTPCSAAEHPETPYLNFETQTPLLTLMTFYFSITTFETIDVGDSCHKLCQCTILIRRLQDTIFFLAIKYRSLTRRGESDRIGGDRQTILVGTK